MPENPEWAWKQKHGPEKFGVGKDEPTTDEEDAEAEALSDRHWKETQELRSKQEAERQSMTERQGSQVRKRESRRT